jgi:hypothetical protein
MASSEIILDDVSVELLYKIFNNLSAFDIYFYVPLVNHRLHTAAHSYPNFELAEKTPKFKQLAPLHFVPSQFVPLQSILTLALTHTHTHTHPLNSGCIFAFVLRLRKYYFRIF